MATKYEHYFYYIIGKCSLYSILYLQYIVCKRTTAIANSIHLHAVAFWSISILCDCRHACVLAAVPVCPASFMAILCGWHSHQRSTHAHTHTHIDLYDVIRYILYNLVVFYPNLTDLTALVSHSRGKKYENILKLSLCFVARQTIYELHSVFFFFSTSLLLLLNLNEHQKRSCVGCSSSRLHAKPTVKRL